MIKDKATIEKPDYCSNCICWHNDSDEGGICKYSCDAMSGSTEVTSKGLAGRDCLFSDEHEI